jgi:hypothetical protein
MGGDCMERMEIGKENGSREGEDGVRHILPQP